MRKRGKEALLTPDKIKWREVRDEEGDAAWCVCVFVCECVRVCASACALVCVQKYMYVCGSHLHRVKMWP